MSASSQASSRDWGQGLLAPWGGGYITMGGLLPDSFKQKAIACWGERSGRQQGGRVLTCWAPKHTSGEMALTPALSPGRPAP